MKPIATPPSNDKKLPSFVHPDLLDVQAGLQWVWDVWHELKDCKPTYLPQEQAEPPKAYKNRLNRSQFDSRFAPALRGFAGLLSAFSLTEDTPQSIQAAKDDIDQQGNSLQVFFAQADEMVLRDGGCGLLVEFPKTPTDENGQPLIQNAADEVAFNLRPYFVLIDRRNILNWSMEYRQGKPFIKRVVIREMQLVDDGDYGCELKIFYRVLRPGSFEVWEIVRDGMSSWRPVLQDQGETNLDRVPLVWYSITENTLFHAQPPFLNLARLNIEHFQKRSSLNEVLHKCNLPVPKRKGAKPDKNGKFPPLALGPNTVVDVPETGEFAFEEPKGTAIAATQADIVKLEDSMDRTTLAFLTGGEVQRTATEAIIDTAQARASAEGMAARKKSAIEQGFALWAAYTGETGKGSIDQDKQILEVPPTPQETQITLDAMGNQISRKLGLTKLQRSGWIPKDWDLEEELRLTEGVDAGDRPLVTAQQIDEEVQQNGATTATSTR